MMESVGIDISTFKVYLICRVFFFVVLRISVLLLNILNIGNWFLLKNFGRFYFRDIENNINFICNFLMNGVLN